ncbi:MAG TPA: type II toxin-antitoxin system Phd/YefM family antitoxin [Blastocatellia bacterium]|nr:type II toxin-antitoxin system Phd/YefM family antitoxin [Blastocatellia bacterium]
MQTYHENQQSLSFLLEQAQREGEIRIQRANGQIFILKPETVKRSALDVAGIKLNVSTAEIVQFIREGRERS